MLLGVLISVLFSVVYSEGIGVMVKPCSFPVPLEMPNRNDRADQCWLRIEDDDLVETVTVFCYIAHGFLRFYIHDYNTLKMRQDKVNVALWSEEARPDEHDTPKTVVGPNGLKDWKSTTVLDPATHKRLYVTKNADCRLIMYTREGMSNYRIDCETILFYVNSRMTSSAVGCANTNMLPVYIFLLLVSLNFI